MKKEYNIPDMRISEFDAEQVLISNSLVIQDIKDNRLKIDGKSGNDLNLFSFNFKL